MQAEDKSKRVTASLIESWQAKAKRDGRRVERSDSKVPGLVIRVGKTGTVSFKLLYRMPGETAQRNYTIPTTATTTLEQARKSAEAALESVKASVDPHDRDDAARRAKAAEKHAEDQRLTFRQLAEAWITTGKGSKRAPGTIQINRYQLDRDVLPVIGGMKAVDVTTEDIQKIVDRFHVDKQGKEAGRTKDAKVACNRTVELVRAVYGWGLTKKRYRLTANPAKELIAEEDKMPGGHEKSRKRYLNAMKSIDQEDQITTFWTKLSGASMSPALQRALKLALLTGQRISNCTEAEVCELNLKARLWSIPWHKVKGRTEDDGAHHVPLSEVALGVVIEALNANGGRRFLFPSPRGDKGINGHAASHAVRDSQGHFGLARFTPHDLRRTAATGMAQLGVTSSIIGHILAHREVTNTTLADDVYIGHDFIDEKRAALDLWASHLSQLLGLQPSAAAGDVRTDSNIVPLKSAG